MFQKKRNILSLLIVLLLAIPAVTSYAVQIDTQVILSEKKDKFLAFSGVNDHWVSEDKRLSERLLAKATEGNVGIIITSKRILGFSVLTDQWTSEDLKISEDVKDVEIEIEGNVATMTTNMRVLGYSANTGKWVEFE